MQNAVMRERAFIPVRKAATPWLLLGQAVFLAFSLSAMTGCNRQTGTSQTNPPSASASQSATNSDAAQNETDQVILNQLTQAVRRFGAEQQRRPQSLQELVDKGYLPSIPAAPRERNS